MRTTARLAAFCSAALILSVATLPGRAADDTILRHVAGNVGYTTTFTSPYIGITGQQVLDDNSYAVVTAASRGIITLADSSTIGVGANSRVRVSSVVRAAAGSGATIEVPSTGGTIRFDVKHPAGARANYVFRTPTSAVAVRGTSGLLESGPNGDVITCLDCAPNDVAVTVGARTYPLLTGQTLTVTLARVVTTLATTIAILQSFSGAGLTTSATASAPVTAGAASGAAAGGAAAAAAAAVAAGAAAASSGNKGPQAQSTSTGVPTPVPTQTGNLNLSGGLRR